MSPFTTRLPIGILPILLFRVLGIKKVYWIYLIVWPLYFCFLPTCVCLLQSPTFDNGCEYIWELLPKEGGTDESGSSNTSSDLRENINVQFSFDYQRSSTFSAEDQGTFQSAYQLGNLQVKASPCNVLSLIIKNYY